MICKIIIIDSLQNRTSLCSFPFEKRLFHNEPHFNFPSSRTEMSLFSSILVLSTRKIVENLVMSIDGRNEKDLIPSESRIFHTTRHWRHISCSLYIMWHKMFEKRERSTPLTSVRLPPSLKWFFSSIPTLSSVEWFRPCNVPVRHWEAKVTTPVSREWAMFSWVLAPATPRRRNACGPLMLILQ